MRFLNSAALPLDAATPNLARHITPRRELPRLATPSRFFAFLLITGLLMFSSLHAHAETGILDGIAASYKNATAGWATVMLGYANRLFILLATIELAWSAAIWVLDKNEFQSLVSAVAKKIMWLGMFYALLLNGHIWVPFIIDSFSEAGAVASGTGGLSPSKVFSIGLDNAWTIMMGSLQMGFFEAIGAFIFVALAALLVIVCFAVIAAQLLVALVESYIIISAGLLFLGFGGSRWTNDFVQKYISYAISAGVRLLMLYLIVGIGTKQAQEWSALLAADESFFHSVFTVLGGSLMFTYLAVQIPSLAAALLSGSPLLTGGSGITTSAAIAAGMVGLGAKITHVARTTIGPAASADRHLQSVGNAGGRVPGGGVGAQTVGGKPGGRDAPSPGLPAALPISAGGATGSGTQNQAPSSNGSNGKTKGDRFLHGLRYGRNTPPGLHDGTMPASVHIKLDPPPD